MDRMRLTSFARELQASDTRARTMVVGDVCGCGCMCYPAGDLNGYTAGVADTVKRNPT